ncbi:unnamed protein product, partial [Laminaria digitata]
LESNQGRCPGLSVGCDLGGAVARRLLSFRLKMTNRSFGPSPVGEEVNQYPGKRAEDALARVLDAADTSMQRIVEWEVAEANPLGLAEAAREALREHRGARGASLVRLLHIIEPDGHDALLDTLTVPDERAVAALEALG